MFQQNEIWNYTNRSGKFGHGYLGISKSCWARFRNKAFPRHNWYRKSINTRQILRLLRQLLLHIFVIRDPLWQVATNASERIEPNYHVTPGNEQTNRILKIRMWVWVSEWVSEREREREWVSEWVSSPFSISIRASKWPQARHTCPNPSSPHLS